MTVAAWPSKGGLEQLPSGAEVAALHLDSVPLKKDGSFLVTVDSASIPANYRESNGSTTFEVSFRTSGAVVPSWFFSSTPRATHNGGGVSWGNERVSTDKADELASNGLARSHVNVKFDSVTEKAEIVEVGNEPESWVSADGLSLLSRDVARESALGVAVFNDSVGAAATPPGNWACGSWSSTSSWQYNKPEKMANVVGTLKGKAKVTQTHTSSHTLGVSLKMGSGSWGGGNAGGTSAITTNDTDTSGVIMTGINRNSVNYRKFTRWCFDPFFPGERTDQAWFPVSVHTLNISPLNLSRPNWDSNPNACSIKSGGHFTKTQGSNVTYSGGVSITPVAVNSKASFTSSTSIRWDFTGSAKLCGSTSQGPLASPQAGVFVP